MWGDDCLCVDDDDDDVEDDCDCVCVDDGARMCVYLYIEAVTTVSRTW